MSDVVNFAQRRAARRKPHAVVDEGFLEEVAASLDLRKPNALALATVAHRLADHYADSDSGFEGVVDAATGVGKTYIIAGGIDYLTETAGVRNFAVITPGRTILSKTVANFTPAGRKSLLDNMVSKPLVVTSENFASPLTRAAMDDDDVVKLFVFTVQALVEPRSQASRRTRKFQEGLGEAFYDHLVGLKDLVVFADEHHVYYGRKFSSAIRGLEPWALIGLTATPHPDTPVEQIIFRYPLANAIADRIVKTPVLVGRRDDLNDAETKLRDGVALLEAKAEAVRRYVDSTGQPPINPVMLVVCESIEQAREVEDIVASPHFANGKYAGSVLRVTSDTPDASLAMLAEVEEPDSPVRIVVSVGMLKEGWDVSNVYVIASLRPSVSEILTEQTVGRGLRLPWGAYTDVELLDTLEVLAHERYESLLSKARVLREELIDWRTVARPDNPVPGGREIQSPLIAALLGGDASTTAGPLEVAEPGLGAADRTGAVEPGFLTLVSSAPRIEHSQAAAHEVAQLVPSGPCAGIQVPVLSAEVVPLNFSLADVTNVEPFRNFGRQLRLDPEDALRRTLISARTVTGRDGITRVELDTRPASEAVYSQGVLLSQEEVRPELIRRVVLAPQVPPRASEVRAAGPLVDAFLEGLGTAVSNLGGYIDRAAGGLVELVAAVANERTARPEYREVLAYAEFAPVRTPRPQHSADRYGAFQARIGYRGWVRSMHDENWFDSRPERTVANALDESELVSCWARLLNGDLPILWNGMGRMYNPDFLVVEETDEGRICWIVEVKAERDLATFDVTEKRLAAERWAAHVSSDDSPSGATWRYLILGERDIESSKGWSGLRAKYLGR